MRIIDNPNAIERRKLETEVNRLAIALLGYLFITSMVSLIVVFIKGSDINGIAKLISSFIGLGFIWFMYRKDLGFGDLMEDTREIPTRVFFNALIIVIGIQPIFQLMNQGVEAIFMGFNYEVELSGFDRYSGGSFPILLNLVIVGPVIEEFIFRGLLLRTLSQYGKNFAIITTSILFGMIHASLVQNSYAFVVGIVLAYITLRYSIKWAIIIHCTNNMIMVIIAFLNIPYQFNYGFLGIFFVWGIIILIIKRNKVIKWFRKGRSKKNAYLFTFTNMYIIAYLVLTLILTIMGIKIESVYG